MTFWTADTTVLGALEVGARLGAAAGAGTIGDGAVVDSGVGEFGEGISVAND